MGLRAFWILAKLSFRNLWRNPRRTLLTVSTITFGLTVLLWTECTLEGRQKQIIDVVTSGATGHVQIYDRHYLKDHQLQFTMKEHPTGLREVTDAGAIAARRVQIPTLISSGETSATISFQGIEPAAEARITALRDQIVAGSYLEDEASCGTKSILIGRELAQLLDVDLGQKVVLMTQTSDGSLGSDAFRVRGIFDAKSPEFNKRFAFATIPCATELAALRGPHEIVLRLPDERDAVATRSRLAGLAGPDFQVTTWREVLPSMSSMITFNHAMLALLTLILFTVVSLGIVNTLLMSVFERTREFGVMIALGTSPTQLGVMITMESLVLGLVSAGLATALGSAILFYHARVGFDLTPLLGHSHDIDGFQLDTLIYPVVRYGAYLRNVGIELVVVLLAALYPAWRAARLNPVESLRHV